MARLNVPYFAQNDNERWRDGAYGDTQCNLTSHSMLIAYLKPEIVEWSRKSGFVELESYVRSKFYKHTYSRGDHAGMTRMLDYDFGIKSQWRTDGELSDVRRMIDSKVPVVIGVDYKTSGHIVVVTGYDSNGFYVNDPYGIRSGASDFYSEINYGSGLKGKDDYYSLATFNAVWFPGEGWYRKLL